MTGTRDRQTLDGEQALRLLATMWRIRALRGAGRASSRRADEVHGLIHLSVGQEGVAAARLRAAARRRRRLLRAPRARARDREGRAASTA